MNTDQSIDLCILTDLFIRLAAEAGVQPEAVFSLLDRQINTNPFVKKICFVQPENVNLSPVLLQHGISAIPVKNSEMQMGLEALLLPKKEGEKPSILIAQCQDSMMNLLLALRQAGLCVNVLGIGECPQPYESMVKNWFNVTSQAASASDETTDEEEKSDPEPETNSSETAKPIEEVCECPDAGPESIAETVQITESLEVKPEVKPEVKITLKPAEDPKPLPKIKKDHEVSLHKKAIDESSSLACKTSLFMGLPDITPKSKEQAVNSFRIVKCLAHCFQWLGYVLENQENKKRITECSSCIVKLCKIANKISNLELSKISVECKAFIEQEINPKWPVPELKSSETVDVAELSQIEKKIANQLKKSGPLETELEVWNRLAKQIKSLKNARKISQDSLKSIQRDIYTLFQDFHVKPDNSRICNLIQQIQSRLTGKLNISYEMSLILDAIDDQQIEKEFAACSEQELKDKYQNDPNIQKLRQFFRDKILVIAGGTPKKEQKECFAKAFQCEIDWVETNHSQPLDHFIDAIKNERVGALLTLQDKASHKHSLELYTMAKKEGKKLFRIAHMNPILIAYKMMKQFSDNLQ